LEQQRQAAAASNPNDPVDPAAFFQDLPPTLRQSVSSPLEIIALKLYLNNVLFDIYYLNFVLL
jgi:hypothetical protein